MVICGGALRSTVAGGGSLGVLSRWIFEKEWEERGKRGNEKRKEKKMGINPLLWDGFRKSTKRSLATFGLRNDGKSWTSKHWIEMHP